MKLAPECMSCLVKQVERAIKLLKLNASDSLIVKTQHKLIKFISEQDPLSLTSEMMGTITYKLISETLGIDDPYYELKKIHNNIALKSYPDVIKYVRSSQDPLKQSILMSIYGNGIDYGAPVPIDLSGLLKVSSIRIDDESPYHDLIDRIKISQTILILGDNAGETVFDKIMVEIMTEKFPEKRIFYSVRSGPIINDSTMEDAEMVGMTKICRVVESSQSPGVILEKSSPEFQEIFHSADLIISKGQGNFESLISIPTPKKDVYFLLKAKCELIAKLFNVRQGDLVLRKKVDIQM